MEKTLLIHPEELSRAWIDRMAAVGCDALTLHPVGGYEAHLTLERMLESLERPEMRSLLDYAAERGLAVEYAMHSARYLMPASLFETHPTYFRMNREGVRTPDFNFCVSNDEALSLYAENAAHLAARLYRTSNRFFFWMDDCKDAFCHCERCSRMTPADQQLKVLNAVIRRLRCDIPTAKLSYLAYFETIHCPMTVKPEEGIFVEYAPIERDFHKTVDCMPTAELDNIRALLNYFGRKDARVLEYWYDNSLFSKWTKPPIRFVPNNDVIRYDISYYRELGFYEIASFACYLGADYEALWGVADISAFAE